MANYWTYDASSGYTLVQDTATDQCVCIDSNAMPAACEIVLTLNDVDDAVSIVLFGSGDGRTRWAAYCDGTNIGVKKYEFGIDDSPLSSPTAHGIGSGVPFTLSARLIGNVITVSTTATGVAQVTASYTITDELADLDRWGFSSAVDGARVLSAVLYQLIPSEATRAEVLLVVCGGKLYECSDDEGEVLREVPGRVADTTGQVGIGEWDGLALIVGGGLASTYDPVTKVLAPWYDEEHEYNGGDFSTLPGATEPVTGDDSRGRGTTKATIVEVHNKRVFLSGWSERPELVFASEQNNYRSFRLNNVEAGEASAYSINAQGAVTCLKSLASNNLLIGCRTTMRVHLGDPSWGQPTTPLVSESGVSGPFACVTNEAGLAVAHSPAGLFYFGQDGSLPQNISSGVLTEGIQFPQQSVGQYKVSLVRDPAQGLLFAFVTPAADEAAFHLVYAERGGMYRKNAGYLFPEQFPIDVGPTAAILWRGEVLLGTRNGLVLTYDPDEDADATGLTTTQGVESWMTLTMAVDSHPVGDTIITCWRVLLADESDDVSIRVYGAATAESLFDQTRVRLLFSSTVSPYAPPFITKLRSPAISLFIYSGPDDGYWELEQVVGNFEVGRAVAWTRRTPKATPPAPGNGQPTSSGGGGAGSGDAPDGSLGGNGTSPPGDGYGGGSPPGGGGNGGVVPM